ncbi:multidrug transporter [Marinobacter mobilis]|uniref:Multidrug transporter n=1 Tax=Marinobacter mobilis TaxID=488533 RepID=A0A1H2V5W2_9GAMM|nr:multidrug transporter [Marinobacter mobilis]SDW63712.1 hypothetical protein SAMN04487960_103346 [Marinobacter mobilis]
MSFPSAIAILATLGGVLVIAGLAFFIRPKWFLGWLKGTLVLCLLLAGGYSLVMAAGLTRYQSLASMDTIASLRIAPAGEQTWTVALDITEGESGVYSLNGDQWQLDARIIRFSGPFRWFDIAPGYRLERLSGRYLSLEQERYSERSVVSLSSGGWPDLWELERTFNLPFVEAVYGSATFMPMAAGATFDVRLSSTGLVAMPTNEAAFRSVRLWSE